MTKPVAVDLFAGAGGATQGLRDAGFDVVAAVENDETAALTWKLNHPGVMLESDIRDVSARMIMSAGGFEVGQLDLLKSCPPCQGFSTLRGDRAPDESRNDLVLDTLRLVSGLLPKAVLLENVPGLRRDGRFGRLVDGMRGLGYSLMDYIVEASTLGVPQRRRRLVVIAIRGDLALPVALDELIPHDLRRAPMSAGQALESVSVKDPVHVWRPVRGVVGERIRAIPVNGNRFDLPIALQLDCHKRLVNADGKPRRSASGSYGRVKGAEPSPTMTTRCTTPACGAFIHPTEHRGLSLREAAALQTFPAGYRWAGKYGAIERQIGNAVPVWMAEALGAAVLRELDQPTAASATEVDSLPTLSGV